MESIQFNKIFDEEKCIYNSEIYIYIYTLCIYHYIKYIYVILKGSNIHNNRKMTKVKIDDIRAHAI